VTDGPGTIAANSLMTFDELFADADRRRERAPIAVAGADDDTVIDAVVEAESRGWIAPILVGSKQAIESKLSDRRVDARRFQIVGVEAAEAIGSTAVALVKSGEAFGLMKGRIATPELLKAVLNRETGVREPNGVVGQIVMIQALGPVQPGRTMLLADTGITPAPTLEQKRSLLRSLVDAARSLGSTRPRIAIMSATEKANSALPDTLDAEPLVDAANRGEFGPCDVAGPMSFDLAFVPHAAEAKSVANPVFGRAEGMLFPDLNSANLTVKALMYAANTRAGGFLCGTRSPVVFLSRSDLPPARLCSIAAALEVNRVKVTSISRVEP
jgi:phosphotransacetylase